MILDVEFVVVGTILSRKVKIRFDWRVKIVNGEIRLEEWFESKKVKCGKLDVISVFVTPVEVCTEQVFHLILSLPLISNGSHVFSVKMSKSWILSNPNVYRWSMLSRLWRYFCQRNSILSCIGLLYCIWFICNIIWIIVYKL